VPHANDEHAIGIAHVVEGQRRHEPPAHATPVTQDEFGAVYAARIE
jgi:hypothetical protein